MLQFLDYIILMTLIISFLYHLKNKKSNNSLPSIDKIQVTAERLQALIEKSESQLKNLEKSIAINESAINIKMNEALTVLDDMKFINNRAEKLMDTLSSFIKLDNRLKVFLNDLSLKHQNSVKKSTSFDEMLNVAKHISKKQSVTNDSNNNNIIQNMILKISANYE